MASCADRPLPGERSVPEYIFVLNDLALEKQQQQQNIIISRQLYKSRRLSEQLMIHMTVILKETKQM